MPDRGRQRAVVVHGEPKRFQSIITKELYDLVSVLRAQGGITSQKLSFLLCQSHAGSEEASHAHSFGRNQCLDETSRRLHQQLQIGGRRRGPHLPCGWELAVFSIATGAPREELQTAVSSFAFYYQAVADRLVRAVSDGVGMNFGQLYPDGDNKGVLLCLPVCVPAKVNYL